MPGTCQKVCVVWYGWCGGKPVLVFSLAQAELLKGGSLGSRIPDIIDRKSGNKRTNVILNSEEKLTQTLIIK